MKIKMTVYCMPDLSLEISPAKAEDTATERLTGIPAALVDCPVHDVTAQSLSLGLKV
jgi:hypothetical protein